MFSILETLQHPLDQILLEKLKLDFVIPCILPGKNSRRNSLAANEGRGAGIFNSNFKIYFENLIC